MRVFAIGLHAIIASTFNNVSEQLLVILCYDPVVRKAVRYLLSYNDLYWLVSNSIPVV